MLFSSTFLGSAAHTLTSPLLLKPRISKLMLDVLPDWISWRCRKRLRRALPRPLSSSPCVRTPNRVDFPESTFPSTATRRSKNYRKKNREIMKVNHCCAGMQEHNMAVEMGLRELPSTIDTVQCILLRFCSCSANHCSGAVIYSLEL